MEDTTFHDSETEKNNIAIPKLLVTRLFFFPLALGKNKLYKIKNYKKRFSN